MRFLHLIVLTGALGALVGCARSQKQRTDSLACGNYMVSIGFAARLYAEDRDGYLPSDLLSMSNEVITPKILVCPGDDSRQPAASWAVFTPADSSYEIVTPHLREGDSNRVFLRCKIHGSVLYGDGSVFVNGQRHHKF